MSKAVLISINPKWCELIASGRKTVEVRKTRPKLQTPFKCYIYCTKPKGKYDWGLCRDNLGIGLFVGYNHEYAKKHEMDILSGTVIGEFICDCIEEHQQYIFAPTSELDKVELGSVLDLSCLSYKELVDYTKNQKHYQPFYGWHISDLKIYDKPQELNWFVVEGDCDCMNCKKCSWFNRGNGYNVEDDCDLGYENIYRKKTLKPIFRPPQSWCYVEELEG